MTRKDKAALTRCIEMARKERDRAWQISEMLKDRPWDEVARFAAYSMQCRALNLKPWESPPCHADEDDPGGRMAAHVLLRRMLAAGLSRYEPDPLGALAAMK